MLSLRFCLLTFLGFLSTFFSISVFAALLPIENHDTVVGKLSWTQARQGETFSSIGRRYDLGYIELVIANPGINPNNIVPGTIIVLPNKYVLPKTHHKGIVLNVAELRLYYYLPDGSAVFTFPVGVGRKGWETPMGNATITKKIVNPEWVVPESIKKERALKGTILPDVVPAGPDNPLGDYAMRLSIPAYLIHGTNDPYGIGKRSSAGCIRMLPEDVEKLFSMVDVGTPVTIVNEPYKLGILNGNYYLEAHPIFEDSDFDNDVNPVMMSNSELALQTVMNNLKNTKINDIEIQKIVDSSNGIPTKI